MKTRIAVLLGVLLSLLAWVSPAPAEGEPVLVTRKGDDVMRLTGKPCTDERVRAHIAEDLLRYFKAGTATIGGKTFALCWALQTDGVVFLRYEDGDRGGLRSDVFRLEQGI